MFSNPTRVPGTSPVRSNKLAAHSNKPAVPISLAREERKVSRTQRSFLPIGSLREGARKPRCSKRSVASDRFANVRTPSDACSRR